MSIPVNKFRCETKFFTSQITPLRVYTKITIHKSQGITIGEGQEWDQAVIKLPPKETVKQPGMDITAIYCLSQTVMIFRTISIGSGKAYDQRRLLK